MVKNIQVDVVVIGGGATGAGVIRDLAMRGFSAVLVERADLAQGTSSRFHGLLHSGGRYVISDPESATECAQENAIVRRIHANAVEETGGLFVVTPYDAEEHADKFLQAAHATRVPAAEISVEEALRREPRLHPKMKRAFEVEDASVDGWALVWGAVESARAYGAQVLSYHRATRITVEDGKVSAVYCHGEKTGEDIRIDCRFVINCGGPWAGQIAALAGAHGVDVVPGRGIMVAMNHRLVNSVVNRCVYPSDGDIIVPAHTVCIIGTTDQAAVNPDFLEIKDSEVQHMLDSGEAMIPGFRNSRAVHVWSGARPLVRDTRVSATDTRHMSRGMSIIDHSSRDGIFGMLTIAGGKFTTYRLMAKNVVDAMCEQLEDIRPCTTDQEAVPAARDSQGNIHATHRVHDRLKEREKDRLDDPIVCECELVTRSMVEAELAQQPEANIDDLRRKLRIGMGPCQGAFCSLRVAGIMHDFHASCGASQGEKALDPREAADRTSTMLRLFVGNRQQGLRPLLFGEQLRESALQHWIFDDSLNLAGLSDPCDESLRATGDLALLHGRSDALRPSGMEPLPVENEAALEEGE